MTVKKLVAATALLVGVTLGTTGASLAQAYYGGPYGGSPYGYEYGYGGYGPYYDRGGAAPDWMRGGPGPRVQDGGGMGIGAVR